jgi:hypothetical protein
VSCPAFFRTGNGFEAQLAHDLNSGVPATEVTRGRRQRAGILKWQVRDEKPADGQRNCSYRLRPWPFPPRPWPHGPSNPAPTDA